MVFRYFHNPDTVLRQVKKLQPGTALYLRQNVLTHKRYWAEDMSPRYDNEEDARQHLGQAIKNAVSTHVVADVPVAIMLSGGIDSSIIALCAAQCGVPIKTFTIGFKGQPDNEFVQAKRFADSLGLENIPIIVEPGNLDLLPQIVYFNDEPVAGPSSLAYYCALKEARKYATVILFGHGADEIVSGYEQLKILRKAHAMYRFPGMRMAARGIAHILKTAFPQDAAFARLKGFINAKTPLEEYFLLTAVCSPSEVQAMLSSGTDHMMSLDPLDEVFNKYQDQETASIVFEQGGWLPDDILHRVDRMTMAHSLEGRVPFLDTAVVECAHGINNMLKLKGKQEKYILRQAFKNELPEHILTRRKQRFNTPIHHFFGKEYEQMVYELFTQNNTLTNDIFDKKGLLKLLEFRNKPSYRFFLRHNKLAGQFYARQIWNVAVYMLWHMTVVEKKDPIALGKQWFS
jgi:asparagine synthase (glutamine-hydrolysing)